MHELIHAITTIHLERNKDVSNAIEKYIEYINSFDKRGSFKFTSPYGLTNSHEFISEFMTNPDFVSLLKMLPSMEPSKFSNIFEHILSFIKKALGIKDKSVYEQIKNIVDFIIDDSYENGYFGDYISTGTAILSREDIENQTDNLDLIIYKNNI